MKPKHTIRFFLAASVTAGFLAGCTAEEPFATEGNGVLRVKMVLNSDVTRAQVDEPSLADKCIIYISNSEGLIRKYQGISSLPADGIKLNTGNYVVEAWTGDSVSASFDQKFYRGYEPMTISTGINNLVLKCNIANVVASVDSETIDEELLTDYTITIGNSRASLDFTADNVNSAHGYYMMPDGETTLTWTLQGKDVYGKDFTKTGEINNVQRAHEYVVKLKYGAADDPNSVGGGYITVVIDETENIVEDEITIHAAPKIQGIGFDIDQVQTHAKNTWEDLYVNSIQHGQITNCVLKFSDNTAFGLDYAQYDLQNASSSVVDNLNANGISWTDTAKGEDDQLHTTRSFIFDASLLNRLDDGEYYIEISMTNSDNMSTTRRVQINVSDASVRMADIDADAIYSYTGTVGVEILKEGVTNPGIKFRRVGAEDWKTATSSVTSGTAAFQLSNLEPGTKYEIRATCDGFENTKSYYFTTEAIFELPNASFEEWSTITSEVANNKSVVIPGLDAITFWDSGNHGSALVSITLTDKTSEMKHSGTYAARLETKKGEVFGIGKLAAGNIFTGYFAGLSGTNGILKFGRPFNGTRPTALKGYLNYRPVTVDESKGKMIQKGEMDQGEIYFALASAQSDVNTSSTSTLFNPTGSNIIAYGNLVLNANYGDDGQLKEFTIPLTYYSGRENERPAYIIIVASSSRYGDYFEGGVGSVMVLDDFSLEYR